MMATVKEHRMAKLICASPNLHFPFHSERSGPECLLWKNCTVIDLLGLLEVPFHQSQGFDSFRFNSSLFALDRDQPPWLQHIRLSHIKLSVSSFWSLPGNCPCHYERNQKGMENVNKNIVEKLLCQEKVEGGEPCGLQSQGGHRLQAGHQHGEDRPAVEQG